MAEPVKVSAIGIAVGRAHVRTERDATVQDAMVAAVTKARAEGVTNPAELTRRALAARDEVR
jgi:hypothetical protein